MKKIEPISFEQAIKTAEIKIASSIPFFVIDAINKMIVDKLTCFVKEHKGKSKISFKIGQDDVVDNLIKKIAEIPDNEFPEEYKPFNRRMIFDKNWLDFESLYREKGWNVKFIKTVLSTERNSNYWIFEKKC